MKQDLMIVSEITVHISKVCVFLRKSGIDITHSDNIHSIMAGLKQHSPAFLLLDFDVKGAKTFLFDISRSFYHPQPYIIVSATFSNGMDRAAMLRQGADACVEKPIIAEEVLAVIEAALRHSRRSTWSHQGKLLSRIEYKELIIAEYSLLKLKISAALMVTVLLK